MQRESYANIDMEKTGLLLIYKIHQARYTVKDIQEKLLLSCPQPIYRWYKGKIFPSVNHLYVLSKLLDIHMEELLVPQLAEIEEKDMCSAVEERFFTNVLNRDQHILAYFRKLLAA